MSASICFETTILLDGAERLIQLPKEKARHPLDSMKCFLALTWLLALPLPALAAGRPNVLFLAIDDQNDWIGCLGGHPQVRTPNIDRLARRGTLFTNAHCQSPLCNSSRASLLTGLRPSSTGIYGLAPGIRDTEATKHHVTLPQTFTRADYSTFTCGKIYHDGSVKPKDQPAEFNVWGAAPGMGGPAQPIANLPKPRHPAMDWGAFPDRDEDAADYKIASAAILISNFSGGGHLDIKSLCRRPS